MIRYLKERIQGVKDSSERHGSQNTQIKKKGFKGSKKVQGLRFKENHVPCTVHLIPAVSLNPRILESLNPIFLIK